MKKIEVFGKGCPRCKKTTELIKEEIKNSGIEVELVKIEDINQITERGVMLTPAVAIDGEIVSSGKVPAKSEIKSWFK